MYKTQNIWPVIVLLFIGAFILYANTFQNSFHFDDFVFIVQNPQLSDMFDLRAIWREGSAPTRFITYLTFALNVHVHGYEVFGYHLVNVLIHAMNACLVFWLTLILGNIMVKHGKLAADKKNILAVVVAGFFLTHPLQTQAVTYLCQRFASLATLFYLLTVSLYIKARSTGQPSRGWFYLAAIVAGMAGMFTKQIVLTLPLTIVLVEWVFFSPYHSKRPGWPAKGMLAGILLILALIIPAVYSFDIQTIVMREYESLSHAGDTLNAVSYFLTQSRVIWTYVSLLFLPIGQNLLYDFPASYSFFEPKVLAGFAGIGFLLWLAVKCRKERPFISFGILWFFTTLLVESSIIPIRHVIFEHRCYLPFFGFALVLGSYLMEATRTRSRLTVVACIIIGALSLLTYKRNQVWTNDITLWSDVIKKNPHDTRPYTHLATAYLNEKNYDQALTVFTKAIVVDPGEAESYNNRGNVHVALNRTDLALKDYLKALSIDPTLEKTYNNIGIIYNKRKDFGQALAFYNRALELNYSNAGTYFNRANVYLQLNDLDKAFADYSRSIEINPFQRKAFYYRSQIYASQEKFTNALDDALKAQSLGLNIDQTYLDQLKNKIHP